MCVTFGILVVLSYELIYVEIVPHLSQLTRCFSDIRRAALGIIRKCITHP